MRRRLFLALLGGLAMAACGGSSSNSPTPTPPAETTVDIVTVGPITGFGSVIVNGTAFNTDAATVMMDGNPAITSDLGIGMVVAVRGTLNLASNVATASAIRFANDAEGPVASVNRINNTFTIMGRMVIVDELTVFEDTTFDDLGPGNVVHVSGLWRHEERIQARHVHKVANEWAAGTAMQVKGTVQGLDPGNLRFRIGTQWCDYSGANMELGGAPLENGLYVEVSSTTPPGSGDMILDRVQARDQDRDRDQLCDTGCDFALEGYVTDFVSATEFMVDGQPVTTTASTTYVNGTVENLELDAKVAVMGTLDESGVLVADRIVFRLPSVIEIEADAEAIDTTNSTLTVLGISVTTNDYTTFRDHGSAGVVEFGLDDLVVGDRVEIRACLEDGTVVATRLERDDPEISVTLKAPVEEISEPNLTVLGITVASDAETVFQNTLKAVIDSATFFTIVNVDDLVRAEGSYDGASILADKLFLRECENSCL